MFRIRKVNKKNIAEEIKPGDIVQHFKRTDDMQGKRISLPNHRRSQAYRDKRIYGRLSSDVWRFSDLRPPNGYVSQPS